MTLALVALLLPLVFLVGLQFTPVTEASNLRLGEAVTLACLSTADPEAEALMAPGVRHYRFVAGLSNAVVIDLWGLRFGRRIYLVRWER